MRTGGGAPRSEVSRHIKPKHPQEKELPMTTLANAPAAQTGTSLPRNNQGAGRGTVHEDSADSGSSTRGSSYGVRCLPVLAAVGVLGLSPLIGWCGAQSVPSSAAPTAGVVTGTLAASAADPSIRPFQFHATDEALADLRKRVAATQWPEKETVG